MPVTKHMIDGCFVWLGATGGLGEEAGTNPAPWVAHLSIGDEGHVGCLSVQ